MGSGPPFKKDLSQYTLKIQQVKNNIEEQIKKEKSEIYNLKQQKQYSIQNIENEQNKFQTLYMIKIELEGYLNEQVQKLSTEKQKQYEKDIEELKKSANQLNFENKLPGRYLPEKEVFNPNQMFEFFFKEAEQIKNEFFKSLIQISRKDLQKEIDQFNKIYLEIQTIKLEMNTIEEKISELSKELHTNNSILSERRSFNENMVTNLILLDKQIKTKFNEIYSFINKEQAEKLLEIQIELNKQKQLSQLKQADLDYQTEIINNLKQKSQELQNQISKYERENDSNKNLNNYLQEQISNSEKQIKQQIENLEKMKDENKNIAQAIIKLRIEFEEKISKFELDSQNQIKFEQNEINDIIENQIKVSLDNNQILANFQQMMNKSLQILQLQNDRLVSIKSQLEQSQKIIIENQEKIEKKDKEIFDKNNQIENLQNQIEELEQNNSKLKKEVAKYRKQQEKKYEPKDTENFSSEIQWIDIYYESETPYTHSLCRTKAKVNSNAIVFCNGGCPSFHLKSAVFDLLNSQVYEQLNVQKLPKDHVYVGGKYRSLLDSGLQKAGINDKEKRDFLQNVRISYLKDCLSFSKMSESS